MIATTILALGALLVPQNPQPNKGGLRLPPPQPEARPDESPAIAAKKDELQRFRDLLHDYSQAKGNDGLLVLDRISREFLDVPGLVRQVARIAVGDEMVSLTAVAERFCQGDADVARDFALQVQVRKLNREAVEATVGLLTSLQGTGSIDTHFRLARAKDSGVRGAATGELESLVTAEHFQQILSFANDRSADARRIAVRLLAALGDEEAVGRLVDMLSAHRARDLSVCADACEALVGLGDRAAPVLHKVLARPPVDHAWYYSAFALAEIEDRTGTDQLEAAHAGPLFEALDGADLLSRALSAVPLARLHWRGAVDAPDDARVVAALLDVAAPRGYVSNLALLQGPTDRALGRLAGRAAGESRWNWRAWWEGAESAFVPMRRELVVAEGEAARLQIRYRRGNAQVWFYGEELASGVAGEPGRDLLLGADDMRALFAALEAAGLGQSARRDSGGAQQEVRHIELRLEGKGFRVGAPLAESPWFDRLEAPLRAAVDRERWQFFRDPVAERDFDAFWRAESAWRAAHPEPEARNARLFDRVLAAYPGLDGDVQRAEAVATLLGLPEVQRLVDETRGRALLDLADQDTELDKLDFHMIELAMAAPGDSIWRRGLDLVDAQLERGLAGDDAEARAAAVSQIFSLMGPERVLAALSDPRKRVRLGAIDECVASGIREAGPALLASLDDDDGEIRRASVFALGRLRVAEAREAIVSLADQDDTPRYLREECLVALGRIGGAGVVGLLKSVLALGDERLAQAAVRGLGELRASDATVALADLFAARHGDAVGALARTQLLAQGGLRAVPALRFELARVESPEPRRALLELLADFQDPQVVGELYPLLADLEGLEAVQVVAAIEDCTGLELSAVNDRLGAMDRWWATARSESQGTWLVQALDLAEVPHDLAPAALEPGAGPAAVPELTRIMETAPQGRLRVLAAAVLRNLLQLEFGRVTRLTSSDKLAELARRYRRVAAFDRDPDGK